MAFIQYDIIIVKNTPVYSELWNGEKCMQFGTEMYDIYLTVP